MQTAPEHCPTERAAAVNGIIRATLAAGSNRLASDRRNTNDRRRLCCAGRFVLGGALVAVAMGDGGGQFAQLRAGNQPEAPRPRRIRPQAISSPANLMVRPLENSGRLPDQDVVGFVCHRFAIHED